MSIEWKRFSIALLSSIIITGLTGIILSSIGIIEIDTGFMSITSSLSAEQLDTLSDCLAANNIIITIASPGTSTATFLPLWGWISLGILTIPVLATLFYITSPLVMTKKK